MFNQMGAPAVSGLDKTEVQNEVQKIQMNKINEGYLMPETNKKSRPGTAALSTFLADGLPVKVDPEIVAPRRTMASKSRQAEISQAVIAGQFMLYGQTEDERQEAMQRIEQASVNDDGLSDIQSLLAKRDLLRNRKEVKS